MLFRLFEYAGRKKKENQDALKNIAYILDVEKNLFAAHRDPERFRDALKRIAEYLQAETVFFWGCEASEQRKFWSTREEKYENGPMFQNKFPDLFEIIREKDEIVYDMELSCEVCPEEKQFLQDKKIRNMIAVPIKKVNGQTAGILGAANLKKSRKTAEPLRQVSISFAMTAEQHFGRVRLERIGHMDLMTGLLNRNGYHTVLDSVREMKPQAMACVYIDVNGLHDINNRLGHQAGDEMLIRTADALKSSFSSDDIFRIGGDEFVVLSREGEKEEMIRRAQKARRLVGEYGYTLSVGIQVQEGQVNIEKLVNEAEAQMRSDKCKFYEDNGMEEQLRILDEKTVKMVQQKQDMDLFLEVIAPLFKGVYFVDMKRDTIRHIYIPSYFEEILKEEEGSFLKGIHLYFKQMVKPEYYESFQVFYEFVVKFMDQEEDTIPEFKYQKKDGSWIRLCIMRIERKEGKTSETLWIFWEANRIFEIGGADWGNPEIPKDTKKGEEKND